MKKTFTNLSNGGQSFQQIEDTFEKNQKEEEQKDSLKKSSIRFLSKKSKTKAPSTHENSQAY